jgi:ribonuclease P protein component
MINRANRFHGRNSLRFTYQRGQIVRGSFCSLKYVRNQRRAKYRVAVVVSRKVSKSAVVRNRIRRRVYEIVRAEERVIAEPYDLVFTAFSDQLAAMDFAELQALVVGQLRQAGVLKNIANES